MLLQGAPAILAQVVLGVLALTGLVYKRCGGLVRFPAAIFHHSTRHRLHEKPQRPWLIWGMDVMKQVLSSLAAHICGMIIAIIAAHRSATSTSECAWYFVAFTFDTTLGVAVTIALHRGALHTVELIHARRPSPLFDAVLECGHYGATARLDRYHLMHTHTHTSSSSSRSSSSSSSLLQATHQTCADGHFSSLNGPCVSSLPAPLLAHWCGCAGDQPQVTFLVLLPPSDVCYPLVCAAPQVVLLSPMLVKVAWLLDSMFTGHPNALLAFVMVVCPLLMNMAQLLVQDWVLRWRGATVAPARASDDMWRASVSDAEAESAELLPRR